LLPDTVSKLYVSTGSIFTPISEVIAAEMTVGNERLQKWDAFQWHDIHTKFILVRKLLGGRTGTGTWYRKPVFT